MHQFIISLSVMNFVNFLLFLTVSNAEPLPLNLDKSDLVSTSSPLLNLPFPESPLPESPLPESPLPESPLPDSLSLNLPASGNDPSPFNLFLNDIDTQDNPASRYSAVLAHGPSDNGAGDDRESIAVLPSITYADTQTNTDDFDGICHPDSNSGQNRRKRQSTFCVNQAGPAAPPILPIKSQAGSTEKERRTEPMIRKDIKWLDALFTKLYGKRRRKSREELAQGLSDVSHDEETSCIHQPVVGTYPRPFTLCCLGPAQFMTLPSIELRLARRQDTTVTITNWFNCQVGVPGRPYCEFYMNRFWRSHKVCCRNWERKTDPIEYGTEPDWWQWGSKGVDCVDQT